MAKKLALLILVVCTATALFAQGKSKDTGQRTVLGTVVDKQENPIESAIIYLKNVQTNDVTTHFSDKDGTFRFSGLDLNLDYQIHAEKDGLTSASRTISSFETRKELSMTLKIDRKKEAK
jgi:hypothetical protein